MNLSLASSPTKTPESTGKRVFLRNFFHGPFETTEMKGCICPRCSFSHHLLRWSVGHFSRNEGRKGCGAEKMKGGGKQGEAGFRMCHLCNARFRGLVRITSIFLWKWENEHNFSKLVYYYIIFDIHKSYLVPYIWLELKGTTTAQSPHCHPPLPPPRFDRRDIPPPPPTARKIPRRRRRARCSPPPDPHHPVSSVHLSTPISADPHQRNPGM